MEPQDHVDHQVKNENIWSRKLTKATTFLEAMGNTKFLFKKLKTTLCLSNKWQVFTCDY